MFTDPRTFSRRELERARAGVCLCLCEAEGHGQTYSWTDDWGLVHLLGLFTIPWASLPWAQPCPGCW